MNELKKQIKEKRLKTCYLFYGADEFNRSIYEKKLKEAVLSPDGDDMNLDVFEGGKVSASELKNAFMTYPFLAEKRLVIVKNSGFFSDEKKSGSEEILPLISEIPESTCVLFVEEKVDKRLKLFKAVSEYGFAAEFKELSEREISDIVKNRLKKNGLKADAGSITLLVRNQNGDLMGIWTELDKLIQYKAGESPVTEEDIRLICSKTLESKIFELIDAIGGGKAEEALFMYNDMLRLKESPVMILSMMSRQFRLMILGYGFIKEGKSLTDAAEASGQKLFPLEKAARQCREFTYEKALWALNKCLETDVSIKTGALGAETAVELLIVECCS